MKTRNFGIGLLMALGMSGSVNAATIAFSDSVLDNSGNEVTGGVAAGTQFQVFADPGAGGYVTHQLVTLDVAVPEPSSAALLGIGGLAVLLRRRR